MDEIIVSCTEDELNCLKEIMKLQYKILPTTSIPQKPNPYGINKTNVFLHSEKQLSDILYYMHEKNINNNNLRNKIQNIGHHMFNW
jgi:hypothetical protein